MWSNWVKTFGFKYPDENLVRYISRNYKDINSRHKLKVLLNGFASGRHVIYFAKEGFDTYGIDITEEAVKMVNEWLDQEKLRAKITLGDALQLPYSKGFFDIVEDWGMIEHFSLENRKIAFEQIAKVLKKDGVFILVAKNMADYYYGQGKEIEKNTFILNTYFVENLQTHFYSKEDLLNELGAHFTRIELECVEQFRENLTIKLSNWYAYCKL
jgi:cyclopropane fatty-acyl-phospholipid synthase-like methyltransferase